MNTLMSISSGYEIPETIITREIFFNLPGCSGEIKYLVYLLAFSSIFFMLCSLYKRTRVWKLGTGDLRFARPLNRLFQVFKNILIQKKIRSEIVPGVIHSLLFYGFAALFIATLIIMIQQDIVYPLYNKYFINGDFYLLWSLAADVAGMIMLLGLIAASVRRYLMRPSRLDTKFTDTFLILLLAFIIITGFLIESIRIALSGMPDFEKWSAAGYFLAQFIKNSDTDSLHFIHRVLWFIHMISAFLFIALAATGKPGHIIISALNIFFSNPANDKNQTKYSLALIPYGDFEKKDKFGANDISALSWKTLLDSEACVKCNRCQDNCPAFISGKPLSPKKLMTDLKKSMDDFQSNGKALYGDYIKNEEVWSCTSCASCMESCPVNIEHTNLMIELKRYDTLTTGNISPELEKAFRAMELNFNPFGLPFSERGDWVESAGVKTASDDTDAEYLLFAGCSSSFDKRNQMTVSALVKILNLAGIKIRILGKDEFCCGDPALRCGNEYLFRILAKKNIETFMKYKIKKIITPCAHCYNVFQKEYKLIMHDIDSAEKKYEFEFYHHTEIIYELLKNQKIRINRPYTINITYHDPCFIGRYNGIYSSPRKILALACSGENIEMTRNKAKSLCCGGGGGMVFMNERYTKMNLIRTNEADSTGASLVVTACPFCLTMFLNGISDLDKRNLKALDIAEVVYGSMEKGPV